MLTRRRLPHLYVIEQPLFLTFRLYDSLPDNRHFRYGHLASGQEFVAMDRQLDAAQSGPTYLRQPAVAPLIVNSLQKGVALGHYELHAWVVMPNHVHMLATPHVDVTGFLKSLKTQTAKDANRILGRTGMDFWQRESYDHLVRSGEEFRRIQLYIHNNPVRAGLARQPESYRWSSAEATPADVAL